MACVNRALTSPYRAARVVQFTVIGRMGRAPVQRQEEGATRFRMAMTVAFGKPSSAATMASGVVAALRAVASWLDLADAPTVLGLHADPNTR